MKNILITGGLGYIGGRLAAYFKSSRPDANVIIADRKMNKPLPGWAKGFKFVPIDVTDSASLKKSLKGVDIIIHLAAVNEIDSLKNPELALEINTAGTYKLLNQAKINNVKRFIYFSTFHVYGDTSDKIITERTPTRPFHSYAITHRAAEDMVAYFERYHGIKGLIFRLSNGFGYPMDKDVNRWTLIFNDLCRQSVTTGRIVLNSSGRQYRNFISLHDVARAVDYFIFKVPDKWGDGLYNVGSEKNFSILDVAKEIAEVYAKKYNKKGIKIETKDSGKKEVGAKLFIYSIDKIKKTGFRLKGNMKEEIIKTMDLCEQFIK